VVWIVAEKQALQLSARDAAATQSSRLRRGILARYGDEFGPYHGITKPLRKMNLPTAPYWQKTTIFRLIFRSAVGSSQKRPVWHPYLTGPSSHNSH